MANRYKLTCPSCHEVMAVDPPQAGSSLACRCGKQLEVPTFRAMRELPIIDPAEKTTATTWGFHQGLIALGLILTMATAIPGIVFQLVLSTTTPYQIDAELQQTLQELDTETPLATWMRWHHRIIPLAERGLAEIQTLHSIAYEHKIRRFSMYRLIAFSASGCAALGTLVVVMLKRSASSQRRRDAL